MLHYPFGEYPAGRPDVKVRKEVVTTGTLCYDQKLSADTSVRGHLMPKAIELLREGRSEELWQMCCGFTSLSLPQFMTIQKRLLLEQLELLRKCPLGLKVMRGATPETVEEFRQQVPLTTYSDYCPELLEKREDILPEKPVTWVRTSGKSGEYPCKWVPLSAAYAEELSSIMYGVGIFSSCSDRGDISSMSECPRIVYTVAPRPYTSGVLASLVQEQTPSRYLPSLETAEGLPFNERVKLGFGQALSQGLDFFFGLSLVLVAVGNKFAESSDHIDIRSLLNHPAALLRLATGLVKSKIARRPLLPRDLWSVKGIMCGGLDSGVYKEKIKELWGRYPLDVYASTEGGIIATQTWDYSGMTFIPTLNFLEFIPEAEHFKCQHDHSYQPKTVLLDEVKAGENYEVVITNLHGSALVRYRIGDLVRITSLRNEELGIDIPQMAFERRADDLLDFAVVRVTEKKVWQAIEKAGVPYEDWAAIKEPEEVTLHVFIELKNGYHASEAQLARVIYEQLVKGDDDPYTQSRDHDDLASMIDFKVKVSLLPAGAFADYTAQRQAEGADLAHLKPPHINPSEKVLSLLRSRPRPVEAVEKVEAKSRTAGVR